MCACACGASVRAPRCVVEDTVTRRTSDVSSHSYTCSVQWNHTCARLFVFCWPWSRIKVQRFLRILAKSRNGTEGTEILGIPVPVTGNLRWLSTSPTRRPTRGMRPAHGAAPRLLTARRFSCARTARPAVHVSSGARSRVDGSLTRGYLATGTSGGQIGTERIGTDRNGSEAAPCSPSPRRTVAPGISLPVSRAVGSF